MNLRVQISVVPFLAIPPHQFSPLEAPQVSQVKIGKKSLPVSYSRKGKLSILK